MNTLTLLFGLLLCLVAVNARHFEDRHAREILENEEETLKRINEHNPQARHRKRRWQSNHGYDYPPPSFYYPDRSDYERNQAVLQHISRLLEEISVYIRRPPPPPPPPQPIYIPYPVAFSQIPSVPCVPANTSQNVTTRKRTQFPMDSNQNWGLVESNENDYDDGSDGSRPISFEPIVPKTIMKRPAPPVEHGSAQASVSVNHVTDAPKFIQSQPQASASVSPPATWHVTEEPKFIERQPQASSSVSPPGMCNAAILSCCKMFNDNAQQRQCFINIGCSSAYSNGNPCTNESFQKALNSFTRAYAPMK